MSLRNHRLDLSILRRRHNTSSTNTSGLSPTVPTLESPLTFHAMAGGGNPETLLSADNKLDRSFPKPSMLIEERDEDTMGQDFVRRSPANVKTTRPVNRSIDEEPAPRPRQQYYEDSFSIRGSLVSPRTRAHQESVVVIEITVNSRLNIDSQAKDNEYLVSTITSRLAHVYQKPTSLVMVTLQQNASIQFGGTGLPAYLLKVFALPYLIAPITNLRSTILIQSIIHEILQIAPNRGVVLYMPIHEENFATNGVTTMGEAARLERYDQDNGILKNISHSLSRRMKSSSAQSRPLSMASSSSWAYGKDRASVAESIGEHEPQSSGFSQDDGRAWSVKKARSLGRLFPPRRSGRGSSGERD